MTPKRIQRSRAKGWRMPENTVVVSRPSKYGNPFIVGVHGSAQECVNLFRESIRGPDGMLTVATGTEPAFAKELRGKNLACWCALDQPCHADILLEFANNHGKG